MNPRTRTFWTLMTLPAAALALAAAGTGTSTGPGAAALDQWLERQAAIHTWSADVLQIRSLKSLAQPLESRGKVWFSQPNRFRWELGDPPRTIALRRGDELIVAYPRLKQVERYGYGEQQDPALKQALSLLEVGLPAKARTFHARYQLLDASRGGGRWRFEMQPREPDARRLIEQVNLEIAADGRRLLATELIFPDGSIMRNEFSDHRIDPELPPGLFDDIEEVDAGEEGDAAQI